MEKEIGVKRLGIGSLSLVISIFSAAFSFTSIKGIYIGQYILNKLGISLPPITISILLLCLSIFIGFKYRKHRYAKTGMILAILLTILFSFFVLLILLNFN